MAARGLVEVLWSASAGSAVLLSVALQRVLGSQCVDHRVRAHRLGVMSDVRECAPAPPQLAFPLPCPWFS